MNTLRYVEEASRPMSNKQVITLWERFDTKYNKWVYNHWSEGWLEEQTHPETKGSIQENSWRREKWRKKQAELVGLRVIEG